MGTLFLNLCRTFDCVWNDGFSYKLISEHVLDSLVRVMHSYFPNRTFCVNVEGVSFPFIPLKSVVPEATVLGLTSFNLHINVTPRSLHYPASLS